MGLAPHTFNSEPRYSEPRPLQNVFTIRVFLYLKHCPIRDLPLCVFLFWSIGILGSAHINLFSA